MMVRPLIKLIVLSFYCVTFVKSFDFPNESANIILAIMDYFKICNPIIINTILKPSKAMKLFKVFSYHGQQITFNRRNNSNSESFIVFTEIINFKWKIQTDASILVVTKIEDESNLMQFDISIDTEVFFLDFETLRQWF